MHKDVTFDTSLDIFVSVLLQFMTRDRVSAGRVVRTFDGRLLFVCAQNHVMSSHERKALKNALRERLGDYVAKFQPVIVSDAPGWDRLSAMTRGLSPCPVTIDGERLTVTLLERRQHEDDWLEPPQGLSEGPPRLVFYSLKGGVGRTTALVLLAVHLARLGKKVLAIDCDLEAPGLASLLLPSAQLPKYGVLDALVENGLGGTPTPFLRSMVRKKVYKSATGIEGVVCIVPAMGAKCDQHPMNVMPKLSRALMSDSQPDGPPISVGNQLCKIVDRLVSLDQYDAVLIDCRAGLAEIAAGPVLHLSGKVLLFGTDQKQTYSGYKALFAALQPYLPDDIRGRFEIVHAKADKTNDDSLLRFYAEMRNIASNYILHKNENKAQISDLRSSPWAADKMQIFHDRDYGDFDPLEKKSLLFSRTYRAAFGDFLKQCKDFLFGKRESPYFQDEPTLDDSNPLDDLGLGLD